MAFNAYLVFSEGEIKGESTSIIAKDKGAVEITDFGFGVSMPVTTSRSDGGGATVGRANFDVFTCSKGIDLATTALVKFCCLGKNIPKIVLHLFRQGEGNDSGVVKYAIVVFQHCVITKVGITGGGEELPKETLEFNYGVCEYIYKQTHHETGAGIGAPKRTGWSTVTNRLLKTNVELDSNVVEAASAPSSDA
jgi:type VI protein secretion system component Hcp